MAKKRGTKQRPAASSVRLKGRGRKVDASSGETLKRVVLPVVILMILIAAVVLVFVSGYDSATGSSFFSLRYVDVRGAERTSADEVRRLVIATAEKPGVWNADLGDLRSRIEKFPFVKTASVSTRLPGGIRVDVIERVPAAVVHASAGNFLVDTDGVMLTRVRTDDNEFPFVLYGWDEAKTEKAGPENLARLKVYRRMLDEWRSLELTGRVKQVNLTNPREPVAVVEDSGREVAVTLARDNLGKSLKSAVDAINGKGAKVKAVDSGGIYPLIQYLEF